MSWKAVFENPVEPFAEVGTFEHEGRSFSAGGAFYDPARGLLMGYPKMVGDKYVLGKWNGEDITPLKLVSKYKGGFGRVTMYSWRAHYDGRTFSGRNSGTNMAITMRAKGHR